MAEGIVSSVLQKLAGYALNEAIRLYKVSDQITPMQRELSLIQALLKDAHSKRGTNSSVKEWLHQVRSVAYEIEDVLDTFLVQVEENRPKGSGFFNKLKRLKHPLKLNELDGKLKKIVQTLETLYKRKTELGIEIVGSSDEDGSSTPFRPSKLFEIDDSDVVGFESDKQQIVNHLLDESISRRTVFSIVGIGGLGKTTLAKKVYKSTELGGKFDCRAWLSISQKFNPTKLFREILDSIIPENKVKEEDLVVELQKCLNDKKYLIVLDDVWTEDLWERLKPVLPDRENGSRVLLTSRFLDVAIAADCNTKPHELRYLEEDESLSLLFRKAFQKHIQPEDYPPPLLEVAKKLVKKCGGLPLALVALGGFLTKREPTFTAWQRTEQTMKWHNHTDNCMNVLAMSYDDLSSQLKPCFLYFASFPEDYVISAEHITRMWVAERLIPNDEGAGTPENRAEDFLEELIKRCLVQVVKRSWNGYCKTCNMHDLLRDLAIRESTENNFFTVFSKEYDGNQLVSKETRRAALQFHSPTGWYDTRPTNIRSLLCFGLFEVLNYQKFRLLRVLVINGVKLYEIKVNKNMLKGMVHLRYLGFRNCGVLPKGFENISFSTLKNLETFDCKKTIVNCINQSLWEVQTLRHVITEWESPMDCPLNWEGLKNLQTLKWVTLGDIIPKLECNLNLRILKIHHYRVDSVEEAWKRLEVLLLRAEHLVCLTIRSNWGDSALPFMTVGTRGLPCHDKIQCLKLDGEWASKLCIPNVEMFPTNLTNLDLNSSNIKKDVMPILERLQCLRSLSLGWNSYIGKKMICSAGGFPSLQKLILGNLLNLAKWEIKEGAMPILNQLTIVHWGALHQIHGLQHVRSLQKLLLIMTSFKVRKRLQPELPNVEFIISDEYNNDDEDSNEENNDDVHDEVVYEDNDEGDEDKIVLNDRIRWKSKTDNDEGDKEKLVMTYEGSQSMKDDETSMHVK